MAATPNLWYTCAHYHLSFILPPQVGGGATCTIDALCVRCAQIQLFCPVPCLMELDKSYQEVLESMDHNMMWGFEWLVVCG